jgi:ABC-type bacteriocin/lantibiotic exporter with double-glycine peptidase domain
MRFGFTFRRYLLAALVFLAVAPGSRSSWAEASDRDGRFAVEESTSAGANRFKVCGPNSLYVLCRLSGVDIDYPALVATISVGDRGVSLSDLHHAAMQHGFQCSVVRSLDLNLSACSTPFIAHMVPKNARSREGHFVVVTAVESGTCDFVDGTSAKLHQLSTSQFREQWSGFALVRDDAFFRSESRIAVLVWMSALFWIAVLVLATLMMPRLIGHLKLLMTMAWLLVGILINSTAFAAGTDDGGRQVDVPDRWRSPQRDAVNGMYILSQIRGGRASYGDVRRLLPHDGQIGLLDLARATDALRIPARIIKCSPDTLANGELPVIALMDLQSSNDGTYVVIFGRDDAGYHAIDAGYAYYIHIDDETFRRSWSGYALAPLPWWGRWDNWTWSVAAGCLLLLLHSRWRRGH